MRPWRWAPCLLVIACGASDPAPSYPQPSGCLRTVGAGVRDHTCEKIVFTVSVPDQCERGGCGLVLDVHGGTMSAEMEDANTDMRALGREHGYVVVQPSAGSPPASYWSNEDDPALMAFVDSTIAAYGIDVRRVHGMGFSQGGAMSWRLLCDYSERFASVAPAAFAPTCPSFPLPKTPCFLTAGGPSRAHIPILYMHGLRDGLIDFACGRESFAHLVEGWRLGPAELVETSSTHRWVRHTGSDGVVAEMIEHSYAAGPTPLAKAFVGSELEGHCYPGSRDFEGDALGQLFPFACLGENAFTWGRVAMAFFRAHPR